jgi:CheY-like chemotaxis protein
LDATTDAGVYAIAAVTQMTGVPEATLRSWERTYAVVVPARTAGGHRLYSPEDVERLRWLKSKVDEGLRPGAAHRLLERRLRGLEPPSSEAGPRSGVHILIAERDPITAGIEEDLLRAEGYAVLSMLDGRAALQEAQSMQPDLIIVAIMLPGLGGLEVCRALKADPKTSTIPVLVISVLDLQERASAAGADGFMLKPLEQSPLIELVKELLAYPRARRSKEASPS